MTPRAAPEDDGQWPWARIPIAETITANTVSARPAT